MKYYNFTFVLLFLLSLTLSAQNYPHRSNILWVTTPDNTDWLYKTGEEANVELSIYEYGILLDNISVDYEISPELMPTEEKGTIRIKNGKATINVGTMNEPGFRDLRLAVNINDKVYKHHIKLGFSPEKLSPYTKLPSDFKNFWKEAKEKASSLPLNFTAEYVPKFSNELLDCYLVKLEVYKKNHFVYGYLTKPKKPGKYPIVFSPPGAGIKPMNPLKDIFYAENGFIRFDMEIHGIRPNLDRETYNEISQAFGKKNNGYLANSLDDKNHYYMKKVYLSCVRALDYLTSLEDWDGKNLMVQGGSQGGALALITAGLDDRVTACAANHPALSDMAGYKANRAGGYPHFFTKFEDIGNADHINTMAYYDVVNFTKLINCPVFMTWGYNDNVCPATTSYIVYNTLNTEKEALITPVNEHWISFQTRKEIMYWLQSKMK